MAHHCRNISKPPVEKPEGIDAAAYHATMRETLLMYLGELVVDARFVEFVRGQQVGVGNRSAKRGARQAMFVENHRPRLALIRKNSRHRRGDSSKSARVAALDALAGVETVSPRNPPRQARALIFCSRSALRRKNWNMQRLSFLVKQIAPETQLVIAEHQRSLDLLKPLVSSNGFACFAEGDAALSFFRFRPPSQPEIPRSE